MFASSCVSRASSLSISSMCSRTLRFVSMILLSSSSLSRASASATFAQTPSTWATTEALDLSWLPSSTSLANWRSCCLTSLNSVVCFALPPRDAPLRRVSALAGSCAQQRPLSPCACRVQGDPSRLVALHFLTTPTPLTWDHNLTPHLSDHGRRPLKQAPHCGVPGGIKHTLQRLCRRERATFNCSPSLFFVRSLLGVAF